MAKTFIFHGFEGSWYTLCHVTLITYNYRIPPVKFRRLCRQHFPLKNAASPLTPGLRETNRRVSAVAGTRSTSQGAKGVEKTREVEGFQGCRSKARFIKPPLEGPWWNIPIFRSSGWYHQTGGLFPKMYTRWFKITFLSPNWRSLNLWKGHLTIQKRSQRIAR